MSYLSRALSRLRKERAEPATEPWVRDKISGLGGGGGGPVSWASVTGKPTTFPPSAHTHVISDTTGLQSALDGKQDTLVSGTNIKTVNGNSLLGSGNIAISGGAGLAGTATVTPPLNSSEWRETVAATGVTGASKIVASLGAFADTDENDPEFLDIGAISAVPGTDAITFVLNFLTPASGPIKLNWSAF